MFRLLSELDLSRCVAGRKLTCDNAPAEEQNEGGEMKTKALERQCRDLGELITQLQDTHSEIKVAIIKGDLGTASMHAHELADDMACFAKDDAIQMAKAIDSYQDDEEGGDTHSEAEARKQLMKAAREAGIDLVVKTVDKEDAIKYTECVGHLIGQMKRAAENGAEEFTLEVNCPWGGGDDDPVAQGEAAATADVLRAELVEGTGRLANKSIQLHKAWDAAGYSKDDGVRDDLLVHALDIAGELANPNSGPYADDPSMRQLANDAKRLARNLSDIADDFEAEFEG